MDHHSLLEQIQNSRVITFKEKIVDREEIALLTQLLQGMLYPDFFKVSSSDEETLKIIERTLIEQMEIVYLDEDIAKEKTEAFLEKLPKILSLLNKDIQAIYDGDPAAKSYEEILLCYPGFQAISIYRFAHELYVLGVPIIPRMMTEYAHSKTGIDINPGAAIGEYFCIDHGTGIVIGETAEIGDRVKLYQGVTIGAKSFKKDENGNPVKGGKRHPTILNNVVIYANATVLGGETVIGNDCVIGSSAWITSSVKDGEQVK